MHPFRRFYFLRRCVVSLLVGVLLTGLGVPMGVGQGGFEADEVMAALTVKIAKFTDWPKRPVPPRDANLFLLGVVGDAKTQKAFSQFNGNKVKGKKVRVVPIKPGARIDDIRRCKLLFVENGGGLMRFKQRILANNVNILLVSDQPGSARDGTAALEFKNLGGRIGFDCHLGSLQAQKISVDANLIGFAEKVYK